MLTGGRVGRGCQKIGNNYHGFYGWSLYSTLLELQRKKKCSLHKSFSFTDCSPPLPPLFLFGSRAYQKNLICLILRICSLWELQCNLDLVTLNLVTTCDLVTILQRPFFNLLHKIIRFSDSFCRDQKCH